MIYMMSFAKDKYRITIDDRNITFYGRKVVKADTKAKARLATTDPNSGEYLNLAYQALGYYNPSRLDYFTTEVVARIIGDAVKAPEIATGFAAYNAMVKDTAAKLLKSLDIKLLVDQTKRISALEAELDEVKGQLSARTGSLTKMRKRAALAEATT